MIVSGTSVRVAISSTVDTTLARVVGIPTLDASARARCTLQGGPAVPIVARRYDSAPGPGGGFTDYLASIATSTTGAVDTVNPWGYGGRTPATEAAPGTDVRALRTRCQGGQRELTSAASWPWMSATSSPPRLASTTTA